MRSEGAIVEVVALARRDVLAVVARLDTEIEQRLRLLAQTFDLSDQTTLHDLGRSDLLLRSLLRVRMMAEQAAVAIVTASEALPGSIASPRLH